jgi:uncharacterized protein YqgC (DUF456 family)
MDWLHYIVIFVFALFGAGCVLSVVVSLPGTWVMLGAAVLVELLDGLYLTADQPITFGWWVLGVCLGVALFGELLEFIAGALGAKVGGGTRRGMIGAIVGGFIGGIMLTFLLPIPVIGTLVGALGGTFAGAVLGEISAEQAMPMMRSLRPAAGATIGRVLGTVAKVGIAMVVWLVLVIAAIL